MRRQTEQAEEWCRANGATLDKELRFSDEGISGWSGANAKTGALAAILKMLAENKIPKGTVLLVEALDRLTRQDLTVAVPLLIQLVNSGLVLVTLQDKKRWTKDSLRDMSDFMHSVLMLARGHDESQRKSNMVRAAYEAQRKASSREAFGTAPGWLERDDKKSKWKVIKEKSDSVNKVFAMAAKGYGSPAIAKEANKKKWPVPTRLGNTTWHARLPGYLLRNRAVLGEHEYRIRTHEAHEEHWRGKGTGIVIPDFYPRIVKDGAWHLAQAAVNSRSAPRRRDENYFNIWSGLLHCGYCGATIQRKIEYRGTSRGQLVCSNKISGLTDCKTASVALTDPTLLREVSIIAASQMGIHEKLGSQASTQLLVEESRLKDIDLSSERIAEVIATTGEALPALTKKARELSEQRKELVRSIETLKQQIATAQTDLLDDSYAKEIVKVLYEKSDNACEMRAECNTRLRRAVEGVWLWAYDVALVKYKNDSAVHAIALPLKSRNDKHKYFPKALMGKLKLPSDIKASVERRKKGTAA